MGEEVSIAPHRTRRRAVSGREDGPLEVVLDVDRPVADRAGGQGSERVRALADPAAQRCAFHRLPAFLLSASRRCGESEGPASGRAGARSQGGKSQRWTCAPSRGVTLLECVPLWQTLAPTVLGYRPS